MIGLCFHIKTIIVSCMNSQTKCWNDLKSILPISQSSKIFITEISSGIFTGHLCPDPVEVQVAVRRDGKTRSRHRINVAERRTSVQYVIPVKIIDTRTRGRNIGRTPAAPVLPYAHIVGLRTDTKSAIRNTRSTKKRSTRKRIIRKRTIKKKTIGKKSIKTRTIRNVIIGKRTTRIGCTVIRSIGTIATHLNDIRQSDAGTGMNDRGVGTQVAIRGNDADCVRGMNVARLEVLRGWCV